MPAEKNNFYRDSRRAIPITFCAVAREVMDYFSLVNFMEKYCAFNDCVEKYRIMSI